MATAWLISKAGMKEVQREGERERRGSTFQKRKKKCFMQRRIKFHWCLLQMVKHFQEHDKIKKHKFTSDAHLAHYFFPTLKQCKQVTYAFKTPLPLPHPPKSLSSYYLGEKITCSSANVTVPEGCKQQRSDWTWQTGRARSVPLSLCTRLVPSRPSLDWPRSPARGKGVLKPFLQTLGVLPSQADTSLPSGGYATSHG